MIFKRIVFLILLVPTLAIAAVNPNSGIEDKVRQVFADAPDMIAVAKCESNFRQFADSGNPFYDSSHTYIGIFQIAEQIHLADAKSKGFNLATVDGNIGYARNLYDHSGTTPWRGCVNTTASSSSATSFAGQITSYFVIGSSSPQVKLIQQTLNANGYTLATSGPGSPGNETDFFGLLTRVAVRKFQCDKNIICDGNEGTTGYGRVGPKTQAALNALISKQ